MESGLTQRLKEIAESKGLSQAQFAEALGTQRSTVSHLFNGRNKPSISLITTLTEVFPDINIQWLFHGKDKMYVSNSSLPEPQVTDVNNPEQNTAQLATSSGELEPLEEASKLAVELLGNQEKSVKKVAQIILVYDDGSTQIVAV